MITFAFMSVGGDICEMGREGKIYYFPLYLPGSPRRCLGILELMKVCDEPLHGRNFKSQQPHEANFKLTESHLFCMAWENFPAFWVISQGAMEWEIALCKKVSPKSSRSPSPFPHIKEFQEMNDEGTTFLFWDNEEQERGRELGVHNTGGDEAYSTPILGRCPTCTCLCWAGFLCFLPSCPKQDFLPR